MHRIPRILLFIASILLLCRCTSTEGSQQDLIVHTVLGPQTPQPADIWLSHEHILVDFIGADHIDSATWDREDIHLEVLPYLQALETHGVTYFVDPTPQYLGRDLHVLKRLAEETGLHIITNTGFYGARNDAHVPSLAKHLTAREMAGLWISEFRQGIGGTGIKPGFMKIGIDNSDPLDSVDAKLVEAAALTHLETGMTIAAHTGAAKGLWPELAIIQKAGVSPEAFIWVHAQNEKDPQNYLKAAATGCWISLDGVGWGDLAPYVEKLTFLRENGLLDQVLISHDAGWYDPQKETQDIKPYTPIFEELIPLLKNAGFTSEDISQLLSTNPREAFAIRVRAL